MSTSLAQARVAVALCRRLKHRGPHSKIAQKLEGGHGGVRRHLQSVMVARATLCQRLGPSGRRFHRPSKQIQRQKRTQSSIKMGQRQHRQRSVAQPGSVKKRFHGQPQRAPCSSAATDLRMAMSSMSWKCWLPGPHETANYELPIPLKTTPECFPKIRKRDRERAERIRLAGGPKLSLRQRAFALAQERGLVRTRDLTSIGIPRCYLARMCDEGLLIKVSYGIYRAAQEA